MGAQVIVTEVDPLPALEAVMDGFRVMPMAEAAKIGDIFVTLTGDINVIDRAPHGGDEGRRDRRELRPLQRRDQPQGARVDGRERAAQVRPFVEEFKLGDGRKIFVLGEGRLINLAAAEGHPASVMDMSFANQALSAEHIVNNEQEPAASVYPVPREIDAEIARLKLAGDGHRHRHADGRAAEVPDVVGERDVAVGSRVRRAQPAARVASTSNGRSNDDDDIHELAQLSAAHVESR